MQSRVSLWCSLTGIGWVLPPREPLSKAELIEEERIREGMSGNLCRCGAYAGIVEAVAEAAHAMGRQAMDVREKLDEREKAA